MPPTYDLEASSLLREALSQVRIYIQAYQQVFYVHLVMFGIDTTSARNHGNEDAYGRHWEDSGGVYIINEEEAGKAGVLPMGDLHTIAISRLIASPHMINDKAPS